MLEDFEALQAAGRTPQLVIGPWSHTAPQLAGMAEREGLGWLRAHLLGDDRLVRRSPVRLFVTGTGGGWRDFGTWPPGVAERYLYLAEERGLGDDRPSSASGGSGAAAGFGRGDRYRYDPADPTPSLGGPVLLSRDPVVDNAPLEARPDVLVYTGRVLAEPLEAIGHVRVELFLRASLPYFDVFARVCDVDAAGLSRNVCDAIMSVDPDGQEQLPDGSWRVRFNLWPMGHLFAAGHRVRLQVSSGAHPRYARNPGTGADPATATADSLRAVEVEVLHDAEHPSALVLPVAPVSAPPNGC